jgi:hypothetical protein
LDRYSEETYRTNPKGSAPSAYAQMNAHNARSRARGPGFIETAGGRGAQISGRCETNAHINSHARPISPVDQNAARHPHQWKTGVTIKGATTAPSDPPL